MIQSLIDDFIAHKRLLAQQKQNVLERKQEILHKLGYSDKIWTYDHIAKVAPWFLQEWENPYLSAFYRVQYGFARDFPLYLPNRDIDIFQKTFWHFDSDGHLRYNFMNDYYWKGQEIRKFDLYESSELMVTAQRNRNLAKKAWKKWIGTVYKRTGK